MPLDLHRALARLIAEPGLVDTLRRGIGPVRTIEAGRIADARAVRHQCAAGKSERSGTSSRCWSGATRAHVGDRAQLRRS